MKTKHIFLTILCLGMFSTAEAQFLKKLKKKAEKAIERTILKKTDSIVTKKTEKAIDSIAKEGEPKNSKKIGETEKNSGNTTSDDKKAGGILDILLSQTPKEAGAPTESKDKGSLGASIPAPPDNNVVLPEKYTFSYKAIIDIKSNKDMNSTEYLLEPNAGYYAKKETSKGFLEYVVIDNQRNALVNFADINGSKRRAQKKLDIFTKARLKGAYKDSPNKEVKTIGSKKILDYDCNGFEIHSQKGKTQFWVTNDAPATLYSAMFQDRAKVANSPFTSNTMIMEVVFTSSENPEKNYQMICSSIEANTMVLSNIEYKD